MEPILTGLKRGALAFVEVTVAAGVILILAATAVPGFLRALKWFHSIEDIRERSLRAVKRSVA